MSETSIALPPGYRLPDVLGFHGRDREAVSEQVAAARIRKGIMLGGVPVLLEVTFENEPGTGAANNAEAACPTPSRARCLIAADGTLGSTGQAQLPVILHSMLGLRIDPAPLLAMTGDDPLMGPLVRQRPALRVVQSASVFEALTWAVIGQQINLSFAIALRRTLVQLAGCRHGSGLWCYPEAAAVARIAVDELTSRKFSRSKAETLLRLAVLVDTGALDLTVTATRSVDDIAAELLAIKGIGPWTVNYALLRGYGHADCSLHGDVAVRAALHQLLGTETRPGIAYTQEWLEQYRPQRTMVAAHLWASL
jgi:DNA-3-methyladenine glycosylase II